MVFVVLDYALLEPRHVYDVDLNYRQNALLELKLAAIKHLDFDHFFAMFAFRCPTCPAAGYPTISLLGRSPVWQTGPRANKKHKKAAAGMWLFCGNSQSRTSDVLSSDPS